MQTALRYIEDAAREGAALRLGGKRTRVDSGGFFVEPTVFDAVAPDAQLSREEVFGPVLAVSRFKEPDEALALPTIRSTGSPPACGRATSISPIAPPARSRPDSCGSMDGTPATSPCRSAASNSRVSAETARFMPYTNMPI